MAEDSILRENLSALSSMLKEELRIQDPQLSGRVDVPHLWHFTRQFEYPLAMREAPPKGNVFDVGSAKRWAIALMANKDIRRMTRWHTYQDTCVMSLVPVPGLGFLPAHDILARHKDRLRMYWALPEHLPDEPESEDVIYNISVVEHVEAENARKWMDTTWRRLKPGGRYFLTCDFFLRQRAYTAMGPCQSVVRTSFDLTVSGS